MNTLLFAALFDGSLLTILTHPGYVVILAYVLPLLAVFGVTKVLGWSVPLVSYPAAALQWLFTPSETPIGKMTVPQLAEALVKVGFVVNKPPTNPPAAS